jgi:ABC-type transport system involved in multi-copper enzyme maturation permease subunit
MTVMTPPYRSELSAGRDGFAQLLHAEWTKFRTVRGWIIGLIVGVLAMLGLGLLTAGGAQTSCQAQGGPAGSGGACMPSFLLGPGGEPVADSFYFVHQPLTGDGSITVRITSMTGKLPPANAQLGSVGPAGSSDTRPGLYPWAKTGIIIKSSLTPGSAYAAMMAAADNGSRMQWNYTGDTAGLPGAVGPANPRWLRLTRSGDVITGYDSADGTHWTEVDAVTLSGLPHVVQVGLFAASPQYTVKGQAFAGTSTVGIGPTQVTAVFDHVSGVGGAWTGEDVGRPLDYNGFGSYHQAGGQYTVTGTGDIAPIPEGHGNDADSALTVNEYLVGTFAGLIAVGVVAALFITAEYRRNLIRVTFAASPRRGRVLAAKAVVVAAVSFVAGLVGAAIAVAIGTAVTHSRGYWEFPVSGPVEARVVVGTALLAAVTAVLALAIGTIVRRSAATVAIIIVAIVLPYFLAVASVVPLGVADWLLRITPAAGFAVQGAYPEYGQVTGAIYAALSGYYPLSVWGGFAVLCAWTAVALAAAAYLLRRRDA